MFDIDKYLNRYIPDNRLSRVPPVLSRWFGYRGPEFDGLTDTFTPVLKCKHGYWITNAFILVNTFAGLIVTMCMCKYGKSFIDHDSPVLVPSWAAGSILVFNAVKAPLAQPRNTFFGTFLSSLVGIIVMKLFDLSSAGRDQFWVGGALATAISSVVMMITKTVHPPGGAAAMLPCIDAQIRELGWYYLPLQMSIGVVFIGMGCIANNVALVYPMYWWTPASLRKTVPAPLVDVEKLSVASASSDELAAPEPAHLDQLTSDDLAVSRTFTSATGRLTLSRTTDENHIGTVPLQIVITPSHVKVPPLLQLTEEQRRVFEELQYTLDTINVISPEED